MTDDVIQTWALASLLEAYQQKVYLVHDRLDDIEDSGKSETEDDRRWMQSKREEIDDLHAEIMRRIES